MIVSYSELVNTFSGILHKHGMSQAFAQASAELFATTTARGVYSHGVNRFPRIISYIEKGYIHPTETAIKVDAFGSFERWDGQLGMGNLNAKLCMDRACTLAKEHGIGIVALKNTNHWLCGGTYGWQAADNGCIGICWTNTMPNMPAWGAKDRKIGNNPFIIAIPRSNGNHVVIDCAMSQFAYGKIEEAQMKGESLPVPGGYDTAGNITTDPAEIQKTWRVLPIGFWKGSGLSIALDLVAAILSGGNTVSDIGRKYEGEYGLSQVMIAIDPQSQSTREWTDDLIENTLEDLADSVPVAEGKPIYYPGEIEHITKERSLREGIPVLDEVWAKIQSL